jgi:hypothetical protein
MKKYACILVAFLGFFTGKTQDKSEQIVIPLSKPGEKAFLEIGQINGDITVEGYDGKEVLIKASFASGYHKDCDDCSENHRTSNTPPGMKRIESNPVQLSASEQNNTVEVSTESWKTKTNLEIKVPVNTDMELSTVHGNIEVKNITGDLELSGVNGGIKAFNISGSLLSNSVNGDIEVTLKSVNANACSFVTLNGNVDVTLPAAVKATAKMKSDRGEIFSDFDMVMEASKPQVTKEQGQYEVSINTWVFGKINGGGPEYTFQNMHGNIIVRKGQ